MIVCYQYSEYSLSGKQTKFYPPLKAPGNGTLYMTWMYDPEDHSYINKGKDHVIHEPICAWKIKTNIK